MKSGVVPPFPLLRVRLKRYDSCQHAPTRLARLPRFVLGGGSRGITAGNMWP